MSDEVLGGRHRRLWTMGTLATEIGSSYVLQSLLRPFRSLDDHQAEILETHLQNAIKIVDGSRELRGAFAKLVQMLSTRSDLLPAKVLDILSTVQSQLPPMDGRTIRRVVERELGAPPSELFAEFDDEALAAASLGQVHRARLHDGREVVVKVQYPGVDETVRDDLRNVELLVDVLHRIARDAFGQSLDAAAITRELRERLGEELDYSREAANVARFRELFADDPEILVPEVVAERSSAKVLTMSHVEGYPLADVFSPTVDPNLRSWVGEKMFRIVWRQLLHFGVLHTDPHPGNYLVTFHPRLGVLDFGAVREFPERLRQGYLRLARALVDGDRDRIVTACHTLGFLGVDEPGAGMIRILEVLLEPLLEDRVMGPEDYRTLEKAEAVAAEVVEGRLFRSPGHRLFLLRALVGLESTIRSLDVRANWRRAFVEEVAAARP